MHVIFLKLRNPDQLAEVAARINRELPGNTIQPTSEVFTSFEKSIPYLGVFSARVVGLAAVVSALVVMLAMYTTITERTREIGILKAMGASRGYYRRNHREGSDSDQRDRPDAGFIVSMSRVTSFTRLTGWFLNTVGVGAGCGCDRLDRRRGWRPLSGVARLESRSVNALRTIQRTSQEGIAKNKSGGATPRCGWGGRCPFLTVLAKRQLIHLQHWRGRSS
jgi:hypothetical protein